MSRRKAFETSLTSSNVPSTSSGRSEGAPNRRSPTKISPQSTSNAGSSTTGDSNHSVGVVQPESVESDDNEVCFICAEPITYWSVGVCGHRTCHVCAVRLRTFYKKSECTFCKTPLPSLLFSRSPTTPFPPDHHVQPSPPAVIQAALANADKLEKGEKWDRGLTLPGKLDLSAFKYTDEKLGVVFEDEEIMDSTLLLLRFNCPYPDCAFMASDWKSLERHTLSTHGLAICGLCRKQLSRFAHEQVLYPPHLLSLHDPSRLARGQRPPKPRGEKEMEMVKSWDAPHPMCEFCHQAFFGPDELFKHMRERHEECFVCRQIGEKDVYFENYPRLEKHFGAEHYPCMTPACLEKKFVVFPSEVDLRAHMVEEHGESMSSRDRANMRQLPVDFSSTAQPPSSSSNRRRNNHESGRGFTLSREPAIQQQQISNAPPMIPAQAAQMRRAAQVDRQEESSRRRRAFETTLTGSENEGNNSDWRPVGGSGAVTPREDVDEATASRHSALLSKIALLVSQNENKLSSFRSAVRQYRSNESASKDLVDTVYNVLDRDADATIGVIRDVADLFGGEQGEVEKGRELLEAINRFKVEQRDQFPALAMPQALGSNYAGITSGAILNAKRTTQTRRHGAQNVWDRVEAAAGQVPTGPRPATTGIGGRTVPGSGATTSSSFPTLGAGSHGPSRSSTPHSTPWSSGGAGPSSKTPSALTGPVIRSVNYPSASTSTSTSQGSKKSNRSVQSVNSSAAFPALPTPTGVLTKEEKKNLFVKPTGRSLMPPPNSSSPWGSGRNEGINGYSDDLADGMNGVELGETDGPGPGGGGGKKKSKGKQLLFAVSARP